MSKSNHQTNGDTTTDTTNDFDEKIANLNIQNLVRGETPEAIDQQCLDLCRQYIGGSWLNATTTADITVKRITGGLTNQLYHVRLNDTVRRVPNRIYHKNGEEPVEVAIKLYQEKHMKNFKQNDFERLNDIMILTVLSEYDISPRVYGIFNEGFIQAYHEHEQFRVKHQRDPVLLRKLAFLIARIHNLKLPICKTKDFMLQNIEENMQLGYKIHNVPERVKELPLPMLAQRSVLDEWQELKRIIAKLNAPTVFCYNDFRGSNLLVTNDDGSKANKKRIIAVDLEYGGYGARPFDLATFFNEWDKENMLDISFTGLPSDDDIKQFLVSYVEACDHLVFGYAARPENSVEKILHETKVFLLVVNYFFISILLKMTEHVIPNIPFSVENLLKRVDTVYARYFQIKKLLIQDGSIDGADVFLPKDI